MTSPASVDLAGRRALVVEDQFLIALDMEVMLRALGVRAVDLATGIADALAAIDRTPPDLAILDWKLGVTTTVPVAEALRVRGTPFVFVSGYDHLCELPASLRDTPLVRKPVPLEALRVAVASLSLPTAPGAELTGVSIFPSARSKG